MGKRKKASGGPPKKMKSELPTSFQCLFCNHEKSVAVKLDKKGGVGYIHCKVCGQDWSTGINFLSAPVDVYADWVDACDEAAKKAAGGDVPDEPEPTFERADLADKLHPPRASERGPGMGIDKEMDGFIEDDEMDGEGGYGNDDD